MIERSFRGMFTGIRWFVACLFFIATALTSFNAIARYVFKYVIFGSEELCTYIVLVIAFLMFPIMDAENRHLKIDIFANSSASQKLKDVIYIIRGVISIGICGTLAFYGWRAVDIATKYQSKSSTLRIPKNVMFGLAAVSFVIAVLSWIFILLFNKRRPLKDVS